MNFYKVQHRFYCGVDLHTRSMFLCVQDHAGNILLHRDYPADPQRFLQAIGPFRENRRGRLRVYLLVVLARRPLPSRRDSLRARPRPVHEGDSRRQEQE